MILKYLRINGESSGKEIRDFLEREEIHSGRPAYYLIMGRIHANGLVSKRTKESVIRIKDRKNQIILESYYKITNKGLKMLENTQGFYQL